MAAPAFPDESSMKTPMPASNIALTNIAAPRSLKDPVGSRYSSFASTVLPAISRGTIGVRGSPSEILLSTGSTDRYRQKVKFPVSMLRGSGRVKSSSNNPPQLHHGIFREILKNSPHNVHFSRTEGILPELNIRLRFQQRPRLNT